MPQTRRPCVIIGNWKMHKTISEAKQFVEQLLQLKQTQEAKIGLAVPFTMIYELAQLCQGSLMIGAQNMNDASEGAFTGEIAASMLKDVGAQFVLLGHSERRHLYQEDDAFINRKVKKAQEVQLQSILCVGETLEERDNHLTFQVIEKQISLGLNDVHSFPFFPMIAYEPVWAIGHGKNATPELVQEVHQFCRECLTKKWNEELSEKTPILYGGSVSPSNAQSLLLQPDVDGLLVGGASLSLESFSQIVNDSNIKSH